MCIEIFGCRDEGSRDYAVNLGIALQLTNIIRDVGVDLSRGRVYLPQEDLRRFSAPRDALGARHGDRRPFAHCSHFEVSRAREYFQRAARALPRAEARRLVAAEIMGAIYQEILRRIERNGYDVFSRVIRVPRYVRALVALQYLGPHDCGSAAARVPDQFDVVLVTQDAVTRMTFAVRE